MIIIRLIFCLFLTFPLFLSAQYKSLNIQQIGHWHNPLIDSISDFDNQKYSGCYGWTDSLSQRKYAIVGGTDGTYFIEITNPAVPIQRAFVEGALDSCTWREYKTYQNYVYMASDDPDSNRFQIADLSYLPDSVHIIHDSDSIIRRTHTVFIDGNKLYCGGLTYQDTTSSMSVYSLDDPTKPRILRRLEQDYPAIDYVHDMFVRNDTIYASAGFQGLFIFKIDGDSQFVMIGQYTMYQYQGYNHSSYLTENGKYLVFTDEVPDGLPFKVINVEDFSNISQVQTLNTSNYATTHNPYILNGFLYMAAYQEGLWMYDLNTNGIPILKGYFDTYWQNDANPGFLDPPYAGCWGAYPFFGADMIVAVDMQNGLYILDATAALAQSEDINAEYAEINFSNPGTGDLSCYFSGQIPEQLNIRDLNGKLIYNTEIHSESLLAEAQVFPSSGIYLLEFLYKDHNRILRKYVHLK